MEITSEDLAGLVAKLHALDLTDAWRAVLHAVFDEAADPPEVAGSSFG